jgi:hypothetical protein
MTLASLTPTAYSPSSLVPSQLRTIAQALVLTDLQIVLHLTADQLECRNADGFSNATSRNIPPILVYHR